MIHLPNKKQWVNKVSRERRNTYIISKLANMPVFYIIYLKSDQSRAVSGEYNTQLFDIICVISNMWLEEYFRDSHIYRLASESLIADSHSTKGLHGICELVLRMFKIISPTELWGNKK